MTTTHRPLPPTAPYVLDRAVATLRSNAARWAERSTETQIDDLRRIRARTIEVASDLVHRSAAAKGLSGHTIGEEWIAGPMTVVRTLRFLQQTFEGIAATGRVPLADSAFRVRPGRQLEVEVLPADRWDRILYRGWTASVRMDGSVRPDSVSQHLGGRHTKGGGSDPRVALVLGAGNVSSITPLDVVHKLFVEGQVVVLKFNPVNDYVGPFIEHAFDHLIEEGFVRTVYGGADVGEYLVRHEDVDSVHVTGSEQTHDQIVFGPQMGTGRVPRLDKPITSELGSVSPVVVAPGSWSARQMAYQADHVATQLLQNAGYNCNAAKVLVLPAAWPQADAFLEAVGERLAAHPDRPAYYPGTLDRYRRVLDAGGSVSTFGESADGVPPTIIEIDAEEEHPAFAVEAFCRVMAVVRLDGASVPDYLARSVRFCNERLRGTLNATLIVDPETLRAERQAVDGTVDDLRYGTVGVNIWGAAGFPLGVTPWGSYPGNTLDDIGSGIGFVHNARLIDRPEKTVVHAPFLIIPKPPWSVFHRGAATALRLTTDFEASPGVWKLPRLLAAAVRT